MGRHRSTGRSSREQPAEQLIACAASGEAAVVRFLSVKRVKTLGKGFADETSIIFLIMDCLRHFHDKPVLWHFGACVRNEQSE